MALPLSARRLPALPLGGLYLLLSVVGCSEPQIGAVCGSSACDENQVCREGRCLFVCTAQNQCQALETCLDGVCRPVEGPCSTDAACPPGGHCFDSTCVNDLAEGGDCLRDGMCESEHCVDGVCCTSACEGLCVACRADVTDAAPGVCAPVSAGLDPSDECSGSLVCAGGASPECVAPCGNGIVVAPEQCDDGDGESFDGCSATCSVEPGWTCGLDGLGPCIETCGDTLIVGLEVCDDGNIADGDYCSGDCRAADGACGDGTLQSFEACDGGAGCLNCAPAPGYGCSGSGCGPVVYVRSGAAPSGTGESWSSAMPSFADALAVAGVSEIWIAVGVYKPDRGAGRTAGDRDATFTIPNGVAVYGGFAGHEVRREQRVSPTSLALATVLSGDLAGDDVADGGRADNSRHVVTLGSGATRATRLDDLWIRGGAALDGPGRGGGLLIQAAAPTLAGLHVVDNWALEGGGVYVDSSSSPGPLFSGGEMSSNRALENFGRGGALYAYSSWLDVQGTSFTGNLAVERGSALYLQESSTTLQGTFTGNGALGIAMTDSGSVTIRRSTFVDNVGPAIAARGSLVIEASRFLGNQAASPGPGSLVQGAAIFAMVATLTVRDSLFSGNHATGAAGDARAGAVYAGFDTISTIVNCTFIDNHGTTAGSGDAITADSEISLSVVNSLFWQNGTVDVVSSAGSLSNSYSTSWSGSGSNNVNTATSPDPMLVDANGIDGVYGTVDDRPVPLPGSPLIDAGTNFSVTTATDVRGLARLVDGDATAGGVVDIGAYEYAP